MNIDEAAWLYSAAKIAHAEAAKHLEAAHERLVALCESKPEGAVVTTGRDTKVTVTYGVNRTVDQAALNALWPQLPEGARRVFPVKHGIDLKELRYWQANEPETYAVIAQAITAKPAKPSVKVEAVGEQKEAA